MRQHLARPLMNGGIANTQFTKKNVHPCLSVHAAHHIPIPFIWMVIRSFTAIAKFPGMHIRMHIVPLDSPNVEHYL